MNHIQTRLLMLLAGLLLSHTVRAQVKIGGDPLVIQASSILELEAKNRGVLFPRMNNLERDSISASLDFYDSISHGLMIYNTDQNCLNFYDSSGQDWVNMCRVYIPITDTSKANKNTPLIGDVITDSDCNCILTYDSSQTWKPLIGKPSGFDQIVLNGDSLYILSIAALAGDTLVFSTDNRLGIAVANPEYALDVASINDLLLRLSGDNEILTIRTDTLNSIEMTFIGSPEQPLLLYAGHPDSAQYLLIDTNGSIDLSQYGSGDFGTKSPSYLLGVDSAGNLVEFTGFTAVSSSDARLKRDINSLASHASKLYDLEGVSYYWRSDVHPVRKFDSTELTYGVIAQEVEKLYPNLVLTDDQGYKMVNYIGFIPLLLENQKAQNKEIEDLRHAVKSLEERLEKLEGLIGSAQKADE